MMNAPSVLAIGLDAAEPRLIEQWMDSGALPILRSLRQSGQYGRLRSAIAYGAESYPTAATECLWVMFGTGQPPHHTGFWSPVKYHPAQYHVTHDPVDGAYDYQAYPPVYALGDRRRVLTVDVPVSRISPQVNGVQLLGWGGHAPHTPSHSAPAEIFADVIQTYGKNPLLHQDYGCWWDPAYMARIPAKIAASAQARSRLGQDLLRREPWDLGLIVFGETHTAGHDLWHCYDVAHPLHDRTPHPNALQEAYQAVDRAIGDLLASLPTSPLVVVFSLHGMGANVTDMNSMTLLPEFLYRLSFPGRQGLQGRSRLPRRLPTPRRKSWAGEIWQRRTHRQPLKQALLPWVPSRWDAWMADAAFPLASPHDLRDRDAALHWMPATWYAPVWPQMQAFALPAFANGLVRVNLKGREAQGIVDIADYETTCRTLTDQIQRLTDARTGEPLVERVIRGRSRQDALSLDPTLPEADLIVVWRDEVLTDTVDHPQTGRIGPLTYYRTGGHRPDGFVLVNQPQATPLPQSVTELSTFIVDRTNALP